MILGIVPDNVLTQIIFLSVCLTAREVEEEVLTQIHTAVKTNATGAAIDTIMRNPDISAIRNTGNLWEYFYLRATEACVGNQPLTVVLVHVAKESIIGGLYGLYLIGTASSLIVSRKLTEKCVLDVLIDNFINFLILAAVIY